MPRALLAALTLAAALGARAEPWTGPIFDAHLHYNGDAVSRHSVGAAFELFRKNGVRAILANSRPNDGTRALHEASRNAALGVQVVAFIRVYRNRVGSDTWVVQRWQSYPQLMASCREWLGQLPRGIAEQVAWRNGAELFGLTR